MAELRWILLGVGALFCLGLWWWETRRQRQAADPDRSRGMRSFFGQRTPAAAPQASSFEDDSPEDEQQELSFPAEPQAGADDSEIQESFATTQRIEPTFGGDWAAAPAEDTPAPEPEPPPPTNEEKIVTLRVVAASPEQFEGVALVEALRGAGLEHGKLSIFHRTASDGRALFSAANLVKPGTFDMHQMQGQYFPGIVLFTVLEPDDSGPDVVDMMLSAAKQLARQLNGALQDERGAPLTLQRLASLRAEIAHWRHQPS